LFLFACLLSPCFAQAPPAGTGDSLFKRNRFDQARAAYKREAKSKPDSPAPRIGLMRSLLRLDRWDQAISEGKAATAHFPQNADIAGLPSDLYALALLRGGQPDEAKATARAALTRDGNSYWALTAAGRIADFWDEDDQEASRLLRHAAKLRPGAPEAWVYLADALGLRTPPDEVRTIFRRYYGLHPKGYPFNRHDDTFGVRLSRFEAYRRSYKNGKPFRILAPMTERQLKSLQPGKGFTAEVRMRWQDQRILFNAEIDGTAFTLRLDSGDNNTDIKLTPKALRRLRPAPVTTRDGLGIQGKFAEREYKAKTLRIGSLTFGPVVVTGGSVEKTADGAIGGKVFERFAVILDKARNRLRLRYAAAPNPPGRNTEMSRPGTVVRIPFRFRQGLIFVPVLISEHPRWLVFDTGAESTLLSMRQVHEIIQSNPTSPVTHTVIAERVGYGTTATRLEKTDFKAKYALRFTPQGNGPSLTLDVNGGAGSRAIDGIWNPAVQFETSGILGVDFLEHVSLQSVTIDYASEVIELMIARPPFTAPSGYRWVTRDDRYLLFADAKDHQASHVVAATDATRLPPAPRREGWQ
jgi:tetratricopeptide (TPR) repeat protein